MWILKKRRGIISHAEVMPNIESVDQKLRQVIIQALYIMAAVMPFSIALTQIALAVAIIAWVGRIFYSKRIKIRPLGLEWAFMAFIAAELVATVFSVEIRQSVIHLKRLLLIPLIYVIAANVNEQRVLKPLGWVFFASLFIYSLWGVGWYYFNPGRRVQHLHHFMTTGGITMIGAILGTAFWVMGETKKQKAVAALATMIISYCLILTCTRSSWLGFFVAIAVIFYFTRKTLLAILPMVFVIFWLLTPEAFLHRLQHFFDDQWRTNAKRLYYWKVGWEIIKDRPLTGIGDINTTEMYNRYAEPEKRGRLNHFHSNFVHIAVTLGLFGLVAFVSLLATLLFRLSQAFHRQGGAIGFSRQWTLAALAVFVAFIVNGFFEWNFGDAEIITMIWFCTGVSLALPGKL